MPPPSEPPAPKAAPREPVAVIPLGHSPLGVPVLPSGEVVPAEVQKVAVTEGEVINVPVDQSRMIELPVDARDVVVGNGGIADVVVKRPRQIFVMGKSVGQTDVVFLDRNGKVVLRTAVHVHVDIDTLRAMLKRLLPNEKASIESSGETIFLTGSVRSDGAAAQAAQIARRFVKEDSHLVNLLKVMGEQQVLLRVRVAEMQKTALKELGFYTSVANLGLGTTALAIGTMPLGTGLTTAATATSGLRNYLGSLNIARSQNLSSLFEALERQGLIKTLAEPNLTAISGETAKMLAGGEYPVIGGVSSTGALTISWKPFGVSLGFQPVVLSDGKINLKLSSEVSSIDTAISVVIQSVTINGLKVRRAETSVELPSGGSLMIAGMLQNGMEETINGFPGLKDLPILGPLFRSTTFQRSESELVVVVTAFVVNPVDGTSMAFPTDGFTPASDLDLYLLGQLHHIYSDGTAPPPADAIRGPFGYILD
ncbi:MAG: type II and III secretion system protein family protein [Alphaproteobacteria bacterium]|nr:type II and III secretion system protein family protein [Alphaproteobacteria bacterium]